MRRGGHGAITGAAMGATGGLVGASRPILSAGAEIGVFATVPPALEGRAPTVDDVIDAGVMVGALKAAHRLKAGTKAALAKAVSQRTPVEQRLIESLAPEDRAAIADEALTSVEARLQRLNESEDARQRELEGMNERARRVLIQAATEYARLHEQAPAVEDRLAELDRPDRVREMATLREQ